MFLHQMLQRGQIAQIIASFTIGFPVPCGQQASIPGINKGHAHRSAGPVRIIKEIAFRLRISPDGVQLERRKPKVYAVDDTHPAGIHLYSLRVVIHPETIPLRVHISNEIIKRPAPSQPGISRRSVVVAYVYQRIGPLHQSHILMWVERDIKPQSLYIGRRTGQQLVSFAYLSLEDLIQLLKGNLHTELFFEINDRRSKILKCALIQLRPPRLR